MKKALTMETTNLQQLCPNLKEAFINNLYILLEITNVISKIKGFFEDGEDENYISDYLFDTYEGLLDNNKFLYTFIDYVADMRGLPYWMAKEEVCNAIIEDIKETYVKTLRNP